MGVRFNFRSAKFLKQICTNCEKIVSNKRKIIVYKKLNQIKYRNYCPISDLNSLSEAC